MLGAIAGDIIGSRSEHRNTADFKSPLFMDKCGFTDDSVLTLALADSILHVRPYVEKLEVFWDFETKYPAL